MKYHSFKLANKLTIVWDSTGRATNMSLSHGHSSPLWSDHASERVTDIQAPAARMAAAVMTPVTMTPAIASSSMTERHPPSSPHSSAATVNDSAPSDEIGLAQVATWDALDDEDYNDAPVSMKRKRAKRPQPHRTHHKAFDDVSPHTQEEREALIQKLNKTWRPENQPWIPYDLRPVREDGSDRSPKDLNRPLLASLEMLSQLEPDFHAATRLILAERARRRGPGSQTLLPTEVKAVCKRVTRDLVRKAAAEPGPAAPSRTPIQLSSVAGDGLPQAGRPPNDLAYARAPSEARSTTIYNPEPSAAASRSIDPPIKREATPTAQSAVNDEDREDAEYDCAVNELEICQHNEVTAAAQRERPSAATRKAEMKKARLSQGRTFQTAISIV